MDINPKGAFRASFDAVGNALLSPPKRGFGYFRNHGPRDQRKVALTFDDGPNAPSTERLLDLMSEQNVKGTFFCVGINTTWNPDIVARAFADGHVIGNHSMYHVRKGALQITNGNHIDQAEDAITQVIGCRPLLYRPPWGWLTPWEGYRLTQRGYTVIGWDVFTLDWQTPEPAGGPMASEARAKTRPGSIILFHDGKPYVKNWEKPGTLEAIKQLVPALRAEGYEFVTIPELLNIPAYGSIVPEPVRR